MNQVHRRAFPWTKWITGIAAWASIGLAAVLTACTAPQIHSKAHHQAIGLEAGQLEAHGLALITPSTVTGQEEDKQALAFLFVDVLRTERPAVNAISLPETLSAVNRAGYAEIYKQMYEEYRDTGIFSKDVLRQVGEATGARYLAQLKLAGFRQSSQGRFGIFGLSLVDTEEANIRLFLQIWDSSDGAIVWEGVEEMNYAYDTIAEKPVTFRTIVSETARRLIERLP